MGLVRNKCVEIRSKKDYIMIVGLYADIRRCHHSVLLWRLLADYGTSGVPFVNAQFVAEAENIFQFCGLPERFFGHYF